MTKLKEIPFSMRVYTKEVMVQPKLLHELGSYATLATFNYPGISVIDIMTRKG